MKKKYLEACSFMIAEDSLLCSQESVSEPYSEAFESSPHPYTVWLRSITVFSYLCFGLQSVFFPSWGLA